MHLLKGRNIWRHQKELLEIIAWKIHETKRETISHDLADVKILKSNKLYDMTIWYKWFKLQHYTICKNNSQGGRGNFTYLLEGQIHFAVKLFVGRPIKQFWMSFSLIFLVSFDQHVFLQFYYNYIAKNSKISSTFIWKITCIIRKLMKNNI